MTSISACTDEESEVGQMRIELRQPARGRVAVIPLLAIQRPWWLGCTLPVVVSLHMSASVEETRSCSTAQSWQDGEVTKSHNSPQRVTAMFRVGVPEQGTWLALASTFGPAFVPGGALVSRAGLVHLAGRGTL